jgi:beta-N-acetylhexosaminidase
VTPAGRRRALAAAAVVAGAAGLAAGASHEEATPPAATRTPKATPQATPAPRAPLATDVGRLVVLRFTGPVLPPYVRRALREGRAAGVVLFADNVRDKTQLRALTRAIARAGDGRALVLADQEGGAIRIVPWAGPETGAAAQAASRTVRSGSRTAARQLRAAGVSVALAPVADVPSSPESALAGRAFGSAPDDVARAVGEAVRGFREGGVAPTVKHFPGLGAAEVNTDDGPVDIAEPPELAPFEAAVEAGVPLVMIDHARHLAIDRRRIASQSAPVVDGLLRRRLGFRGVAVTDSIEAAAVLETGSVEAAARRSVAAGVDLILTTGPGSHLRVFRSLLARARSSPGFESRVRTSAGRVRRLQDSLGR